MEPLLPVRIKAGRRHACVCAFDAADCHDTVWVRRPRVPSGAFLSDHNHIVHKARETLRITCSVTSQAHRSQQGNTRPAPAQALAPSILSDRQAAIGLRGSSRIWCRGAKPFSHCPSYARHGTAQATAVDQASKLGTSNMTNLYLGGPLGDLVTPLLHVSRHDGRAGRSVSAPPTAAEPWSYSRAL